MTVDEAIERVNQWKHDTDLDTSEAAETLSADVTRLRAELAMLEAERARKGHALDAAHAEIIRMRPVVEAANMWRDSNTVRDMRALDAALDTYRSSAPR